MNGASDEKKENTDEVEHHDTLFSEPLQFFRSNPFSDNFVDAREDQVFSIPQDSSSDTYSFTRQGNSVGLIKTIDAKISGYFSLTNVAGVVSTANSDIAIPL